MKKSEGHSDSKKKKKDNESWEGIPKRSLDDVDINETKIVKVKTKMKKNH
jgi:hypothetical protein